MQQRTNLERERKELNDINYRRNLLIREMNSQDQPWNSESL